MALDLILNNDKMKVVQDKINATIQVVNTIPSGVNFAEVNSSLLPLNSGIYDIGSSTLPFNEIHANLYFGDGSNLSNLPIPDVAGQIAAVLANPQTISGAWEFITRPTVNGVNIALVTDTPDLTGRARTYASESISGIWDFTFQPTLTVNQSGMSLGQYDIINRSYLDEKLSNLYILNQIDPTAQTNGYCLIINNGVWERRYLRTSDIRSDFTISTFNIGTGTVTIGQTVTPTFTATYTESATSVTLSDNNGHSNQVITLPGTSFSAPQSVSRATQGSYTYTLNASSASGTATAKTTTLTWNNLRFSGVSAAGALTEAFIETLTSELSNSKAKTFTVTAGVGEKIYFAYPSRLGTATFTVGGFEGGFNLLGSVSVTNSYSYTETYYLYESTNANLGTTTVVAT